MTTPTILALDASSTMIGWVLYNVTVRACGEIPLKHPDINHRCKLARAAVGALLVRFPNLDAIAIEAPGGRFIGTVIPQCFVSGAIRSLLAEHNIAVCDVSPKDGKKALTDKGNASKDEMQANASYWGVTAEHAADALGVALAAVRMVRIEGQVL